jgi:FixJ family two-component response regulator
LSTFAKIFIIDDDVSVRETMESLIQSLGYDTETFSSAEDYLNCGHILDAACLITDVHMPGMTGFDLLNRLLTDGYSIPVILMSAHPGEALRAAAIEAGAIGFLDKPVNVGDLIDRLNKALKSHSS